MAFSKAPPFDDTPYFQSYLSKALAHPARIIILNYLQQHGITPFYVLKKLIPLASTTTSQHLRFLRDKGLIRAKEKFPHTYYDLNKDFCKNLTLKLSDLTDEFR